MEATTPCIGTETPQGSLSVHSPVSWIKRCLKPHSNPRLLEEGTVEEPACWQMGGVFCRSRKCLFVVAFAAIALALMTLLFLLNYNCIMVWHVCVDDDEPWVPNGWH